MPESRPGPATRYLRQWADGDTDAEEKLFELLHGELRRLAASHLRGERPGVTLQPTALVNDAWVRLVDVDDSRPEDRDHFLSLASRAMRRILIDHARRRGAKKRGQDRDRVPLDLVLHAYEDRSADLLALDEALDRLAHEDPRLARVVELRFFGGLSMEEIARSLGVSLATAERNWRMARIWLRRRLSADPSEPEAPGTAPAP